ncbi:MAG: hypothetical protein ACPGN3_04820 [Opitutales bacterium]
MNNRCHKSKTYQTEIYWENSAIRTFPCTYRYELSDQERVISLTELEKHRFQEVRLRQEFENTKSVAGFRSLAAILFGSLMAGFTGCSEEVIEAAVHEAAPAAQAQVEKIEPAPAASSFGNNDLRVKSGRSLPLPPAMEYGS